MKRKNSNSGQKLIIRIFAIVLVVFFVLTLASQIFLYAAYAVDPAELQRLDQLQAQQVELEEQEADREKTLKNLNKQESSLVEKCFLLEEQSQNLSQQIENTQAMLDEYAAQIKETKSNIDAAQEEYDRFRELFSDRILQLQKTGASHSVWDLVFSSESMSDFFNAVRSYRLLAEKDQEIMDTLDALQQVLTEQQEKLESQQKAEKKQLKKLAKEQKALEAKDDEYKQVLKTLRKDKEKYADEIEQLREEHGSIVLAIEDEKELIRTLEEAEKQRLIEMVNQKPVIIVEEEPIPEGKPKADEKEATESKPEEAAPAAEEESKQEETVSEPAPTVTGSDVVNYAMQFLGNPYVWGGNSLTNGCDCSGFVIEVYRHFGITGFPRTSDAIRNCSIGRKVSISELQPGDLVCYSGHIGIYVGSGKMVNALGEKYGIVVSSIYRNGVGKDPICGRRIL